MDNREEHEEREDSLKKSSWSSRSSLSSWLSAYAISRLLLADITGPFYIFGPKLPKGIQEELDALASRLE